ncbi:helix-turn-helix transcriptional regulator [Actinomadura vinacea]|uniref:Helix-turn-helix transcriptional regulator n=2 Tax=Actinomadura vinacea TaxID=115336 RepID=A0ABN3IW61_9ACTN
MDEVAAELGWSTAKVSRLETAYTLITVNDLNRLLDFYDITGEAAERYVKLAKAARERGWWESHSGILPDKYSAFIGLEADAQKMRTYRVNIMDGLLQTQEYARAISEAAIPPLLPSEVDLVVQVRMQRQSRIRSFEPLELHVVLDEGALRRRIGSADVMRRQLEYLLEVAALPNVRLQVFPFERGYSTSQSFSVLDFQEPEYPAVIYISQMSGSLIIEDEAKVFEYTHVFEHISSSALDEDGSREMIRKISSEYQ